MPSPDLDQIWSTDLFSRRAEADLLIRYIDAVSARPPLREDKKGYTISIDADYGTGKSFFLRRLADTLAIDHAVAFVDAWQDDLADEPLIAIISTLKRALGRLIETDKDVEGRWKAVASKTGQVTKIVAKGLLKKGLGLLITGAAVEAAEHVMSEVSEEANEGITDVTKDVSSSAFDALDKADPVGLIAERIASFEAGRRAVDELKIRLSQLVETLEGKGVKLPIVIIVDELDRCRPTYSIKLLEEAKHLFDVSGLVFVFGMHSDQLAHSVSAAYGPGFDGKAYLRRFIDREYTLSYPNIEPLINHIIKQRGIDVNRLSFPRLSGSPAVDSPSSVMAKYMYRHGFTARDTFGVMDVLETSLNITAPTPLFMPYLFPLLLGQVRGLNGAQPPTVNTLNFSYDLYGDAGQREETRADDVFNRTLTLTESGWSKIGKAYNGSDTVAGMLFEFRPNNGSELSSPTGYKKLVQTLASFS